MQANRSWKRILSLLLTFALLLGLLHTAAFAEVVDKGMHVPINERKNMRLIDWTNRQIAVYNYLSEENIFGSEEGNEALRTGEEWTRLSYTIEMSQPVDLVLWHMKDTPEYSGNNVILTFDKNNAYAQEDFLDGEAIGYL